MRRFEQNAAVTPEADITAYTDDRHIQYVADNVDHNVATIDGTGTFHAMRIIAAVTQKIHFTNKRIPKRNVTAADITAVGRINIEYFKIPPKVPPLTYLQLEPVTAYDPTSQVDVLWKTTLLLQSPRLAWSGMMKILQSSVTCLPMIDLDPNDPSCIYSTLKFVSSQAGNVTPVLTFDQPLYWKVLTINRLQPTDNALKDVVLGPGWFHMDMSFLGSIGNLMAGSGLQEVLQVVYVSNTVNHMLSGKAVSRALRRHLLGDAALHTILLADAYNVPLPLEDDSNKHEEETTSKGSHDDVNSVEMQVAGDTVVTDLTEAKLLYGRIAASDSTVSVEESCSSDVFKKL